MKVWDRNAKIIYSDNPLAVGSTFKSDNEYNGAPDGKTNAEIISEKHESPESFFEEKHSSLIEIYMPVFFASLIVARWIT